jgi:hypothetical protein
MGQELYWVIGSLTNVGKTTIAAALLRILNRRQCPALAFKPYSATLLTTRIDAMCDPDPRTRGYLFGNDAEDLANSSPLTGISDVECIVPVQYICHPHYNNAIVARIGSRIINNRKFFKNDHQREMLSRSDLVSIFDLNDTPIRDMAASDQIKISTFPTNNQEVVESSYRSLASRDRVAAIVCEGVGQFLPLWRGGPTVDHIFHVGINRVRFFPHIRLNLAIERHVSLRSSKTIENILGDCGGVSAVLPLARTSQRELVAEELVEGLLRAAKLC